MRVGSAPLAVAVITSQIDCDEDVYGRKLRNVTVEGRDVGEVLVGEGLAREYGGGRTGRSDQAM